MIQELTEAFYPEAMEIWLSANLEAHSFLPAGYWQRNAEVVRTRYLPHARSWALWQGEDMAGFVSIVDESFIGALFVAPAFQSKGYGRELLDDCKARYPLLQLAVYRDNQGAVRFYRANGFAVLEERANEDSGCMEYLMEWRKG